MKHLWFASLVIVSSGCASHPQERDLPSWAPMPYTPAEIRDARPAGTLVVYRVERPGEPLIMRSVHFVESGASQAMIESWTTDDEGRASGEPVSWRAEWAQLAEYGRFPGDATVVEDVTCEVPAGVFECWLYTVRTAKSVERHYFAKDAAGSPILLEVEIDGQLATRVTLESVSRPSPTESAMIPATDLRGAFPRPSRSSRSKPARSLH